MGAFIVAGIVAVLTLLYCILLVFANASMPAPSVTGYDIVGPFVSGLIIAALIAATHWLPHIGW